jgi:Pentapeptide repeats (9 copies)
MDPQVAAAVIAASISFLTLIGTLAFQYLGRRATSKQLDRTLAEQRTKTLNERFATAAGQLGDDKRPAVRLAGVYAMAGLADDWPKNQQTCVDVLCAYLRLPHDPDPGDGADRPARAAYRADREVRHTAIRVITAHLRKGAAKSWRGLNLDFTGAVFDGGDFSGAWFSLGRVSFAEAEFSGEVSFTDAVFSGGTVDFRFAEFSGCRVSFHGAQFSLGGTVNFQYAVFSGGTVDFTGARFSADTVDFTDAVFSGGTVDFRNPGRGSTLPAFLWTDTPPPGVKLPGKGDQSRT